MGLSMRPFAVSESDASIAERVTDLTVLVDRVTQRPMTNGHLAPVGRDTDFGTRRNLEVGTHKTTPPSASGSAGRRKLRRSRSGYDCTKQPLTSVEWSHDARGASCSVVRSTARRDVCSSR